MSIVILSLLGCVLMVSPIFKVDRYATWITLTGIILAILGMMVSLPEMGILRFTSGGNWWSSVILTSVLLIVALFGPAQKNSLQSNHYALIIFSTVGALLLTCSHHLSVLFLGIEILSIPLFVLAAKSRSDRGYEAALKYFILGAFSSAVFIFGVGLYYGEAATLILNSNGINSNLGQLGVLLMGIALAFKVGLVPFHFWAPDVYDGAPTAVTAFMTTVAKLGAMAVFLQFIEIFTTTWEPIVFTLAVSSILVGGLGALSQSSPKRMMAYGSIAQAGYWVLAGSNLTAAVYFGIAYSIAAILFFWVLRQIECVTDSESIVGLWQRNKVLAAIAMVSLFSMAGFPPFAGFFAKYWILQELVQTQSMVQFYAALIGAIIGIVYYLKPIRVMFSDQTESKIITTPLTVVIGILLVFSIILAGVLPLIPYRALHWMI